MSATREKQLIVDSVGEVRFQIVEDNRAAGRMRVRGLFQKAEEKNGNGRIYSDRLWSRILSERYINERLAQRKMLGETDHPADGSTSYNRVSLLITKLWREGNNIMGEAELLDTPNGRILQELARAGVPIGISSRGRGTSYERDGNEYVNESDYDLITFDAVSEPSTSGAWAAAVNEALRGGYRPESSMNEKMTELRAIDVALNEARRSSPTADEATLRQTLTTLVEHEAKLAKLVTSDTQAYVDSLRDKCNEISETIDQRLAKSPAPTVKTESVTEPPVEAGLLARADFWKRRFQQLEASLQEGRAKNEHEQKLSEMVAENRRLENSLKLSRARVSSQTLALESLTVRHNALRKMLEGLISRHDSGRVVSAVRTLVAQHEALSAFTEDLLKCENVAAVEESAKKYLRAISLGKPVAKEESLPVLASPKKPMSPAAPARPRAPAPQPDRSNGRASHVVESRAPGRTGTRRDVSERHDTIVIDAAQPNGGGDRILAEAAHVTPASLNEGQNDLATLALLAVRHKGLK